MPLMHSESRKIHEQAVSLFARHTTPYALDFELKHKVIIDRFGRYPHRNRVLGRESTAEEAAFLLESGSSWNPVLLFKSNSLGLNRPSETDKGVFRRPFCGRRRRAAVERRAE